MSYAYFDHTPERAHHSDDIAVLRGYVDTIKARHGVSQRDQAAALGIGWTTMRDWLNGNAKWPKSAQMVLEKWASSPTEDDVDGVASRCRSPLPVEEEQCLVAAAKVLDDLDDTVRDWPLADLLDFARHDAQHATFKAIVQGHLIEQESGEPLDFALSEPGQKALREHAYASCQRAVLQRLADLLDAD